MDGKRYSERSIRRSIVLVDDEPLVSMVLKRLLTNYEVLTFAKGGDALSRLQEEVPAVVICDLTLPDMNGMQIYSWLREHRPSLCTRLIFITGGIWDSALEEQVYRTERPVLQKPFAWDQLLTAIEAVQEP